MMEQRHPKEEFKLMNFPRRRPIDFAALRRDVPMAKVLELLAYHELRRIGNQLRGPCPIHFSKSPRSRTFSVNLERNAFQCFKPECQAKGNQLDLWMAVTKLPAYEAAVELAARAGVELTYLADGRGPGRRRTQGR